MRVVVTGGAGFLGSHLCESLLLDFNEVCVIDDMFRGKQKNLENCKASAAEMGIPFHIVMKDASNPESFEIALRRLGGSVDVVYHLAAINGTRWFHERPDLVVRVNHDTLENALNFATSQGARFIFTSSPEVWGDQTTMPLGKHSESIFSPSQIHQRHSYGASKYIGELKSSIIKKPSFARYLKKNLKLKIISFKECEPSSIITLNNLLLIFFSNFFKSSTSLILQFKNLKRFDFTLHLKFLSIPNTFDCGK